LEDTDDEKEDIYNTEKYSDEVNLDKALENDNEYSYYAEENTNNAQENIKVNGDVI
jgi:hypothetical protein